MPTVSAASTYRSVAQRDRIVASMAMHRSSTKSAFAAFL